MDKRIYAFLIIILIAFSATIYTSANMEDQFVNQLKKLSADYGSAVENHNTGALYYNERDYGEAYVQFLKAFVSEDDTRNESDEILTSLGDALYQLGYLEDALKAYEGALQRNSLNSRAQSNYNITYERLMRHKNKNDDGQKSEDEQEDGDENQSGAEDEEKDNDSENERNDSEDSGGNNDDDQNGAAENDDTKGEQKNNNNGMKELEKFLRNNSPEDSRSLAGNMLDEGEGGVGEDRGPNRELP